MEEQILIALVVLCALLSGAAAGFLLGSMRGAEDTGLLYRLYKANMSYKHNLTPVMEDIHKAHPDLAEWEDD
mgnify:CR=1 FL=1